MTDESSCNETNEEIWGHSYISLHAFLNLHDPQFCLQGGPFYIQKSILS